MRARLILVGAGVAGSAAAAAAFAAVREQWRRWGIDPVEAAMPLPGDDLVVQAQGSDTRGIDIAAPPDAVWPWLLQMGYGRAGWYSYDQIDMDHPSADRILPEFQSLAVGDLLPTDPGGGFEVKVLEPRHALVAYVDRTLVEAQRGGAATPVAGALEPAAVTVPTGDTAAGGTRAEASGRRVGNSAADGLQKASVNVRATGAAMDRAMSGDFAASWAFVLEPRDGATRLIERFRVRMEAPTSAEGKGARLPGFVRTLMGFGVFVMVRRQMLGIRDRVEHRPSKLARPGTPAAAAG